MTSKDEALSMIVYYGDKEAAWSVNNLTYNFISSAPSYYEGDISHREVNVKQLSTKGQETVKSVLDMVSSFTNLTFTEVTDLSDTHISLSMADLEPLSGAVATYPGPHNPKDDMFGDISFSTPHIRDDNLDAGEYGYGTVIHEVGHALGLKHTHESEVTEHRDNLLYSAMTYDSTAWGEVFHKGFMLYDIYALQQLYGANMSYRTGNDVYDFRSVEYTSIWDAGGQDTISAEAINQDVTIDLNDGGTNYIGDDIYARGSGAFTIAFDVTIERAIGGSSHDNIRGNEADNYLYGRSGNDYIRGGSGNDRLYGEDGNDRLYGDVGDDYIYGGSGNDFLSAGFGNDRLYGGDGDDNLNGSFGDDRLYGGDGNDHLQGSFGNDYLYGDYGNDSLYGSYGNDYLNGSSGNDYLFGGDGNDRLYGGSGNDSLYGGDGSDRLHSSYGDDRLYGDGGDDYLRASSGNDYLSGGSGNDRMYGDQGDDHLYGGYEDDRLNGGSGNDYLDGGTGNDYLSGSTGNDHMYGGDGDDHLYSSFGSDYLLGGNGSDIFQFGRSVDHVRIGDFNMFEGDVLDFSQVLTGFDPLQESINDFIGKTARFETYSPFQSFSPFSEMTVVLSVDTGSSDFNVVLENMSFQEAIVNLDTWVDYGAIVV